MAGLYQSGWSPRGARKSWDRCSMDVASADLFLGSYARMAGGKMTECVAWFGDDGEARIVVADFDNGRRLDVRFLSGGTKATLTRREATS